MITCRGCMKLGTGCGKCIRCQEQLSQSEDDLLSKQEEINKLKVLINYSESWLNTVDQEILKHQKQIALCKDRLTALEAINND